MSSSREKKRIEPDDYKYEVSGSGTLEDPEISYLIPLEVKKPDNNGIARKVALLLAEARGALKVQIRQGVHTTTRERDSKNTPFRFETDSHITVFVSCEKRWDKYEWTQGDIFYSLDGNGDPYLMNDKDRMDDDGKGIELWKWPKDRSVPRLTPEERDARLDRIRQQGRRIWLDTSGERGNRRRKNDQVEEGEYEDESTTNTSSENVEYPDESPEGTGNCQILGDANVGGNVMIGGSLEVGGDSNSGGSIDIQGNANIGGNLATGIKVYPYSLYNPAWGKGMNKVLDTPRVTRGTD